MSWNYMQVEIIPADTLIQPTIGPGELTRDQARVAVQQILDQAPGCAEVAEKWRVGPKDDTVFSGPFAWTVYEHTTGEDPRASAMLWLTGYADTVRAAGMDVQIASLP